ncbi:MAG TPA: TlpA disulfide reductase family protein [Myxococcales bacterium]|nr:TlpA disulfide reductase family protein [Myxococcales bacterium]
MGALLAALIAAAAAMPVLPATQAPQLVAKAAGKKARPAVLHFWATWCEACRDEFPALRPGLLKLTERGVGVLLVSIDQPQDRQKAQEMLARYQLLSLPAVLLDAPDPDPVLRAMGEPKWDGTLPATFVFDEKGKLRRSFVGRADPAALEAAIRAITH